MSQALSSIPKTRTVLGMQNPWATNKPDKAELGENKAAVWSFTELFSRSAPQITGFLSNTSKRLHSSCYWASKAFLWSEAYRPALEKILEGYFRRVTWGCGETISNDSLCDLSLNRSQKWPEKFGRLVF